MPRTTVQTTSVWSRDTLVAVAVVAVAGSVGALAHARYSSWMIKEVEAQAMVTESFQRRAIDCLDLAQTWIGDPVHRSRAEMSLDLSKGITLCLVKSRNEARLDLGTLAACVSEVEAASTVFEVGADGTPAARAAC